MPRRRLPVSGFLDTGEDRFTGAGVVFDLGPIADDYVRRETFA
jgi:hypothetical protein